MKATLHMDIAATHLRVTLSPETPSWASRVLEAVASRSKRSGSTPHVLASQPLTQKTEETVALPACSADEDPVAGIVAAGVQALEALRARSALTLDDCRMTVRVGMNLTSLSVVPLGSAVGSMQSNQQLQFIAQGVVREALGASAHAQQVRYQVQADHEHLCVAALGASFLTSIEALCKAQRLKLASCQPAIMERLDLELAASARSRDTRTLVWAELDASGKRQALVNYLRIARGSAVNAWRTTVPAFQEDAKSAQALKTSTDRFLIAAGAAHDEQVALCAWPNLLAEPPLATAKGFPA